MHRRGLALALGCAAVAHATPSKPHTTVDDVEAQELTYDVAVIGGGASGAYAAARLQQEGIKVVVIEREDRLGGMLWTCAMLAEHVLTVHRPRQHISRSSFEWNIRLWCSDLLESLGGDQLLWSLRHTTGSCWCAWW